MTKLAFLPAGMSAMWLYQNIDPATWTMIIGITFGLAIVCLALLVYSVIRQNLLLRTQLAETKYQLQMSEERRKTIAQRKPSRRRTSNYTHRG